MRVDLVCEFVCRLLNHMDALGALSVTPTLRPEDEGMETFPWISEEVFNPGYLKRSLHLMPKQGTHEPWTYIADYYTEREILPTLDLDEPQLVYGTAPEKAVANG